MSFESFNLNAKVMAGVRAQGYTTPTPIQLKSIPPIMQGRDIIGLAQTGTGKTAAFVLPVLHRLMNCPRGQVRALIVSPTRELAEQTCETINVLARYTGLRCISIYGGVRHGAAEPGFTPGSRNNSSLSGPSAGPSSKRDGRFIQGRSPDHR